MVESPFPRSIGVAFEAGLVVVHITADTIVFFVRICLVVLVARDAGKFCIVVRTGMAFRTIVPFSLVLTGIYREVLPVVIKSGRLPFYLCVACFAVGAELSCGVRRVVCFGIVLFMAAITGVRGIDVVVVMAIVAVIGNFRMGPFNHVIFIMIGKSGRFPFGGRLMA